MDIATILHLMMGGQTPEQNKGYGITQNVYTSDGGKVYTYYDSDGNPVSDPDKLKAYGKYGGTNPYKPITGLSASFNPAAANYVSQQNNAGFQADYERGIKRKLISEDIGTISTDLLADPKAPLAANITLNAGGTTAPQLEAARQALEMIRAKVPQARATEAGVSAQAGTENALNSIQETQDARKRLPVISQYLDAEAGNRLYESQADKKRLPLKDALANNRLGTDSSNAFLSNQLADNRLNYINQLKTTDRNTILAEAYNSGIIPPAAYPYGTSITPQGTLKPGTINPDFVSPLKMKMAGFGQDVSPTVGNTIGKGPTGRIALPISNPTEFGSDRQPINDKAGALPSIGAPVSASAPKGSNINNVSIGTHLTKSISSGVQAPAKQPYDSNKSLSYDNQPHTDEEVKVFFAKSKRNEMIKRMQNGTGLTKEEVKTLTPEELRSLMAEAYNH